MRQRHSIETREPAAVASFRDIGPGTEEAALLAAARVGHPTAFSDLVRQHAGSIRRIVFRIMRNREDAEDVLQECFKNAFLHFDSFRGQSRFSTWLTRIAMNCALMTIRGRRRKLVALDDSVEASILAKYWDVLRLSSTPEECYSRRELENLLAEEIARLRPSLRGPVVLCHMEGRVAQDAAKVLGISDSALKARLRRARLTLRFRLEHLGIGKNICARDRRAGSTFPRHNRGSRNSFVPAAQSCGFGD